mgnify:CR=1 FL=1
MRTLICERCLIPSSYPGINFDDQQICTLCQNYSERVLFGEAALKDKLGSKDGDRYDAIIGISGGKDSCYVAYYAKQILNLRVLAVCYDFPFMVDLARDNIKRVCKSLDIDFVRIETKRNLEYRLLRNHLTSLAATGTTWGQCLFCHYGIDAVLYNVAVKERIPFILSGITQNELWNPGSRMRFLTNRVKRLDWKETLRFVYYQTRAYAGLLDQRFQFPLPDNPPFAAYSKIKTPQEGPETVYFFNYVHWDGSAIEEILRRKTSWTKPDRATSWRYDCILEPLLDYTYKREFGISTVGLYLSNQIRAGLISREEAMIIQQQSESADQLRRDVERVFDFLKIPERTRSRFFDAA